MIKALMKGKFLAKWRHPGAINYYYSFASSYFGCEAGILIEGRL